ncbi:tryptophan-rich sensory protein [Chamaesiphon sp. OTE_8_metabat_110]|uniref:TspO/MBR family protein n=1 Tax=Chamaesiphon sp. OTE_8_metabat_110 TaxID=2964696 RepID=UPI00286A581B|nr:tryptophan-rich sensory protein [Chamaesiphon sp. OTE_8_metabat_110]
MIKSWLVIGIVAVLVAVGLGRLNTPEGYRWFNRQRRPTWLTFEGLIPVIWTVILICGVWSAYNVWEAAPSNPPWGLMAGYLLLEVSIMLYTPSMFLLKNLRAGTIVGAAGWVIGVILAILVYPVSSTATALLIPYLLWSPIGTYVTWVMEGLNSSRD